MKIVVISGMNKSGAMLLCEKLTEGENYQISDKDKTFDDVCRRTDNIPFYIQHVFAFILESKKRKITEKLIDEAITHLLNDPKDEGFFNHYTDRIKTYYDPEFQKIALFILDKICKKSGFLHEDDIINLVNTHWEIEDETVKETINLLWSDHYLLRKTNIRSYKFKYTILKEWWKITRG